MGARETNWSNEVILPLSLWGSSQIRHKISSVAVSPDFKTAVTGSWDGNLIVWTFQTDTSSLAPRWIVTGQTTAVTTISCFKTYFVACFLDGTICHYQLPIGKVLKRNVDHNYVHTTTRCLGEDQVICAGFYPDLMIINAFTLATTVFLQSREQGDWIASVRSFYKDNIVQIQGITTSGFLKTWSLNEASEKICLENSFGPLNVRHAKSMSFHMGNRWLLLVTGSQILVFDVGIHVICKHTTRRALVGGDFVYDMVVFWTRQGDLFQCDVKGRTVRQIFNGQCSDINVPDNSLFLFRNNYYFIAADIKGSLLIYRLDVNDNLSANLLAEVDSSVCPGTKTGLFPDLTVVSSVHIVHLNKFVAGCNDGRLLVFSVTDLILSYFFENRRTDFVTLSGHKNSVRCLLYPYTQDSEYPESLLVSGGDDFSVCLWDIFQRELLHRFCVHSGPVVRLLTPPSECSARVANTICSISVDHSVAILSLRDRKCAFLASQHPFPIVAVRWKPCHDFLVVKCFDGSVFVWEVRTGVLDRIVCGVAAEEVVYRCDNESDEVLWDFYTAGPAADELPRQPLHLSASYDKSPVKLLGMLSSPHTETFVLMFNVSRLCSYLLRIFPSVDYTSDVFSKFQYLTKPVDPVGLQKTILNVIDSIKQEAETLQEKFHLTILPKGNLSKASPERKFSSVSGTQLIPYAQLFLSLVHVWGRDENYDKVCLETLGLIRPNKSVSFDVAAEMDGFSLRHPQSLDFQRTKFDAVSVTALTKVLGKFGFSSKISEVSESDWKDFAEKFNAIEFTDDLNFYEKMAAVWQSESPQIKNIVRAMLPKLLEKDAESLLDKWTRYLPSSLSYRKEPLTTISLVICCLILLQCSREKGEEIERAVGEGLKFVVRKPGLSPSLIGACIDLIGRGYHIWEKFLSVDDAVIAILERGSEMSSHNDVILVCRSTMSAIAKAKPDNFIAFLKFLCKTGHPILESSKTEIITLIRELLVDAREQFFPFLVDVVDILMTCIDSSHLRDVDITALLGVWLPQVHHNVPGQRIAVGTREGKVVIYELRSRRTHVFPAHEYPVAALRFSPDGKYLMVVCLAGSASIWQLSHGLFDLGVGQFKLKKIRTFPTAVSVSSDVKGVNINWIETKSVIIETISDRELPPVVVTLSI